MNLLHWLVLLPLIGMVCSCIWRRPSALRRLGLIAVFAILLAISFSSYSKASGGIVVIPMGSWGGAHGWIWVVDKLAALFLSAISGGVLFFSLGMLRKPFEEEHPLLVPILFLLVAGMNLSVCAGDFISLLVGWELSLFAAYALFAVGAKYLEIRQAVSILGVNFVATLLLLISVGLCYGIFRTFGLAQMASRVHAFTGNGWFICFVFLFLTACGIKMVFIPLLLKSENIHRILPVNLGAFLAGFVSKLGLYILLRMVGSIFSHEAGYIHGMLWGMGICAGWIASRPVFKEGKVGQVTSSLFVAQIGICSIAIANAHVASFQAALFFVISAMIVDAAIYLMGCALVSSHDSDDLVAMGGTWSKTSALSILWITMIIVVLGIPPFSGFWGKYVLLVKGNGALESVLIAAISFFMFLSMLKVWRLIFFGGGGLFASRRDSSWKIYAWMALCMIAISLFLGVGSTKYQEFFFRCATEILDRPAYHAAVMEALRIF